MLELSQITDTGNDWLAGTGRLKCMTPEAVLKLKKKNSRQNLRQKLFGTRVISWTMQAQPEGEGRRKKNQRQTMSGSQEALHMEETVVMLNTWYKDNLT